jgi:hypothetical protein
MASLSSTVALSLLATIYLCSTVQSMNHDDDFWNGMTNLPAETYNNQGMPMHFFVPRHWRGSSAVNYKKNRGGTGGSLLKRKRRSVDGYGSPNHGYVAGRPYSKPLNFYVIDLPNSYPRYRYPKRPYYNYYDYNRHYYPVRYVRYPW